MTTWGDVEAAVPDLAKEVQGRFEATGLGYLATLRKDGSPPISGIEPFFCDGEVWLGSMWEARKAHDLRRDPGCSLHAANVDRNIGEGDARISGRAVEVSDEDRKQAVGRAIAGQSEFDPDQHGPRHLFALDITEVLFLRPGDGALEIRSWTPEGGAKRIERR